MILILVRFMPKLILSRRNLSALMGVRSHLGCERSKYEALLCISINVACQDLPLCTACDCLAMLPGMYCPTPPSTRQNERTWFVLVSFGNRSFGWAHVNEGYESSTESKICAPCDCFASQKCCHAFNVCSRCVCVNYFIFNCIFREHQLHCLVLHWCRKDSLCTTITN